ncbi:hydroxymethylglutaryl-CoA synthase [Vagococcus sp.]|uniref:hydroxymethylglutaryl-CoA synthase n=1 Tax=Vagococcus sp. TaxID=1933889 RepID=UPI003F98C949
MVGIDKINFYTPNTYVDLIDLANERNIDPNKFTIGIGQAKMAVPPITQDTVSMAANAAFPLLTKENRELIDLVIVGTETGVDQSKATATFVHELLNIQPFAKAVEIKQACYGATAGLMMALDYVTNHPTRQALVIASDISRYGLATGGEVTQGAGAVAMLVTHQPRLLELNKDSVAMTENIFDFWRPNYSDTAIVDGKFSNEAYAHFFNKIWNEHQKRTALTFSDYAALCFHLPYTKMGKKALLPLLENETEKIMTDLLTHYEQSTYYTRDIGNIYTGSLYLGLISLLNHATDLKAGQRIGFFSYGSGAVGEFFSGQLVAGYENQLLKTEQKQLLFNRIKLNVPDYEAIFNEVLPKDGSDIQLERKQDTGKFYLSEIKNQQRHYTCE